MIRTLEEIRAERGDDTVFGFVLVATGAIKCPENLKDSFAKVLQDRLDAVLTDVEASSSRVIEVTGLTLRVETAEAYIAAGMPNGTANTLPRRRVKQDIHPDDFRCSVCGGGYIPETIGMFAGKRYIHNCGD